ncbi:MAG: YybH family protein [Mangrovibacterium sp.]
MRAKSPEEICSLFQKYMAEGDIDALLGVYDDEAVFINQVGVLKKGKEGIREELMPFAKQKADFSYQIKQVIRSGDIALMHTYWNVPLPEGTKRQYAIEVARRQSDGSWRWLIGDPFTVGK